MLGDFHRQLSDRSTPVQTWARRATCWIFSSASEAIPKNCGQIADRMRTRRGSHLAQPFGGACKGLRSPGGWLPRRVPERLLQRVTETLSIGFLNGSAANLQRVAGAIAGVGPIPARWRWTQSLLGVGEVLDSTSRPHPLRRTCRIQETNR